MESCEGDQQVRILKLDRTKLALLLQKNGSLHRSLKAVLTWDIVRKLKGQRHELNRRYTTTWGGERSWMMITMMMMKIIMMRSINMMNTKYELRDIDQLEEYTADPTRKRMA